MGRECIAKYCVVGGSIKELDRESDRLLKEGLQEMNILIDDCNINSMWHSGGVHYVSHWIGMDIHDCNAIGHNKKFETGMCIAVEPGIYLPNSEKIAKEYREIGIRIEDTILINGQTPEVSRQCV